MQEHQDVVDSVENRVGAGRILIVKTGSTVPGVRERRGDFEAWIAEGLGCALEALEVCAVQEGQLLPGTDGIDAVVVTGSAAFVSEREPWSETTGEWLVAAVGEEIPILGICYGHQLLAQAFGGRVGPNPLGRSIGTVGVDLSGTRARQDGLLAVLPEVAPFHVTHVESVLELPPGAVLLGSSPTDPHHAFALGPRTWGVQFHPEFDADILRGYVTARADDLRAEGMDPQQLHADIRDTPHGTLLLRRFAEIVRDSVSGEPA
jgi:GMP synthase (glutamine-hydrolysing)